MSRSSVLFVAELLFLLLANKNGIRIRDITSPKDALGAGKINI
jgi:hypothetical protein